MNIVRGALVVGVAVGLAGCAGQSAADPPAGPVPYGTHHVDPNDGMPAAEVRGTLNLTDGCLMVELEGNEYPLVLPDVAVWDEPTQELTLEGRTYSMGDEVSWVGGYEHGADVPDSCPTGAEIARVFDA